MQLQIGVKVIIQNSKGLFLFIQRSEALSDGTEASWDIPGGRINPDENLEDALAREIQEEIHTALTGTPTLIRAQDIFVPSKNLHVVRLTYTLTMDIETIALSHEHQDFRWVSREKLTTLPVEPYLKEVLQSL